MSIKLNQIYKCSICGNIVEVIHEAAGELVCCNKPMDLLDAKTADMATEKHVPIVQKKDGGVLVTVGSTLHPMEESHYIEFIEIIADGKIYKKFLNPGDKPEVFFEVDADNIEAREYCNIHGLWKS